MRTLSSALTIVGISVTWAAPGALAAEAATIEVMPQEEIGPVNRLILGNNDLAYQGKREDYGLYGSGIWDPEHRRPQPDFVRLAKQAGISVSRWPGGCATHNYNWHNTVGPLADRPDQQWGLPEFMAWCEAIGSTPIISVAVYWGAAADGADLVEYLNSPNDATNPNGGTDWAAVRAADGHPEPYGVVWFEYGNESYHGEHQPTEGRAEKRVYTAEQYARLFLEYQAAMKAVDPKVKLGAVLCHGKDDWNTTLLQRLGRQMDFGIVHTYIPGFYGDTTLDRNRPLMEACVACGPQIERMYETINALVEEEAGRTDLAWAITEYNGHFVGQRESPPFRQALANALRNAEHLRVMMQPRHRIAMANFWQFANEYWGMVRGYVHRGEPLVKQANFYVYQLYNEHFGDTLIKSEVSCGHWDFAGAANVLPRSGEPREFRVFEPNLLPDDYEWQVGTNPLVRQEVDGRSVVAEFSGEDTNYFHASVGLLAKPSTGYRVTGEIKTVGIDSGRGVGFQVGDARGWTATRSAVSGGNLIGGNDWTDVVVDYVTLADASGITIMARRIGNDGGDAPISGQAFFRLRSVQEFQHWNAGAVPDLSVAAAKRADGTITLMIVNTNFDAEVETSILPNGWQAGPNPGAAAWSLVGPTPWATNVGPEPEVTLVETPMQRAEAGWQITLPKHSLTAVELQT
jgi:alpha-N-arabinofuranosidase